MSCGDVIKKNISGSSKESGKGREEQKPPQILYGLFIVMGDEMHNENA